MLTIINNLPTQHSSDVDQIKFTLSYSLDDNIYNHYWNTLYYDLDEKSFVIKFPKGFSGIYTYQ
jgi:hypothetical protein